MCDRPPTKFDQLAPSGLNDMRDFTRPCNGLIHLYRFFKAILSLTLLTAKRVSDSVGIISVTMLLGVQERCTGIDVALGHIQKIQVCVH